MYMKRLFLKPKNLVRSLKADVIFVFEAKGIFLLSKWQEDKILSEANCKHGHCSPMSNSAWCDLKSNGDILKLHDKCPNSEYKF